MSNLLILKDFNRWKSLNIDSDFCLYDYLFQELRVKNVSSDVFFAFKEVFWPKVIEFEGFYFLGEQFSAEKIKNLVDGNHHVEYWMNLLTVDSFFDDEADCDERALVFAQTLAEMWQVKLGRDFSNIKFTVECLADKTTGDYGVTFYQSSDK